MSMIAAIGFLLAWYLIYRLMNFLVIRPRSIDPSGRYVLISGCDTGFGHALAIKLDRQGYHVLAGVYHVDRIQLLTSQLSSRASVFRLDITNREDVDAALAFTRAKTTTLHALVNNAGVALGGFIDWTSMEQMRAVMEVNFFGQVAMTKAFLPLLIARRDSRVVNVSSMCGYISLPGSGAYCASKYALESFSDCLRREMSPWGLRVSLIEPGTMQTSMTEGVKHALWDSWFRLPIDVQQRWGEEFFRSLYQLVMSSPFMRYAESPERVIRVMEHAISSTAPRIRYRPGWQSRCFFFPLSLLPVRWVDAIFALGFNVRPAGTEHQLTADG